MDGAFVVCLLLGGGLAAGRRDAFCGGGALVDWICGGEDLLVCRVLRWFRVDVDREVCDVRGGGQGRFRVGTAGGIGVPCLCGGGAGG